MESNGRLQCGLLNAKWSKGMQSNTIGSQSRAVSSLRCVCVLLLAGPDLPQVELGAGDQNDKLRTEDAVINISPQALCPPKYNRQHGQTALVGC